MALKDREPLPHPCPGTLAYVRSWRCLGFVPVSAHLLEGPACFRDHLCHPSLHREGSQGPGMQGPPNSTTRLCGQRELSLSQCRNRIWRAPPGSPETLHESQRGSFKSPCPHPLADMLFHWTTGEDIGPLLSPSPTPRVKSFLPPA